MKLRMAKVALAALAFVALSATGGVAGALSGPSDIGSPPDDSGHICTYWITYPEKCIEAYKCPDGWSKDIKKIHGPSILTGVPGVYFVSCSPPSV